MADTVNTGTTADDGSGDQLRVAFAAINAKLDALQAGLAGSADVDVEALALQLTLEGAAGASRIGAASGKKVQGEIDALNAFNVALQSPAGAQTVKTLSGASVQQAIDALPAQATAAASIQADRAELAADAAFVNANVYADVAAGLAAVADGAQFQVGAGDGFSIQRYRRDPGPVAVAVGHAYPSESSVFAIRQKTQGVLVPSPNLFDKDDPEYTSGQFVNHATGALNASALYETSGFIRVLAGASYYLSTKNYMAWYTAGKVFISGSSPADTANVQTAPAGAAYLRVSLQVAVTSKLTFYVVQGASPLPAYQPYGGRLVVDRVEGLPSAALANGAVLPAKTSFLSATKNLFDKAAITAGQFLSAAGALTVNATYDVSDFMPVTPGQPYVCTKNIRFYAAYDASKTVMSAAGSNTQVNAGGVITPAAGVAFLRVTIFHTDLDAVQFEQGSVSTGFVAYGYRLSNQILLPAASSATSRWAETIAASYGDSITAGGAWQPAVALAHGLAHTAYGVGGRQIGGASGMCQDAAVNTLPTNIGLLMVLGGTNDWAQSRALGAVTSTNTDEFYGALNQMCQKLTTRLPSARIVLLATTYGELPLRVTDGTGWANGINNLLGLTTRDYAEAVRVAGKRWGFPVIDTDACGWNTVNVDAYMVDDGGHIHPNAAGGARMAAVVIGALKAIEPTS